jgi:hypothetical protein
MDPIRSYPILTALLSPFRKSQRKTMALCIAAIVAVGQARSFAVAMQMRTWRGGLLQSALNRFYRLLRNRRIWDAQLTVRLLDLLARSPARELLVAVDWTEWPHDLRLLVASAVVGRRAVPVLCHGHEQRVRARSQNLRENEFARTLAWAASQIRVKLTLLCDRGFRRVSWLRHLDSLGLAFVVRLMDDVLVEIEPGLRVPLGSVLLTRGRVLDLGFLPLRSDAAHRVRIVGYWAPGAREPWWLATNRSDPASYILKLYDRRMTVEQQLRDSKGARFGVKLQWTQFRKPEALGRVAMLVGVAILIWTLVGRLAVAGDPALRLTCRRKGPRFSFVVIGQGMIVFGAAIPPLTIALLRRHLEPPALRRVAGCAVGGK